MAKYWAKNNEGEKSIEFDTIEKLQEEINGYGPFKNIEIFVKSDDLNLYEFFRLQLHSDYKLKCIVYDSCLSDITYEGNNYLSGFENNIIFAKCKIDSIHFSFLELRNIFFIDCNINELKISDSTCQNIRISKNTKINNFIVNDCLEIYNISIQESNIKSIDIRNNKKVKQVYFDDSIVENLSKINNCIINYFFLKKGLYNNLKVNGTTINEQLTLSEIKNKSLIEFNLCKLDVEKVEIDNCDIKIIFFKVRAHRKISFRLNKSSETNFKFTRCYFFDEVLFQGKIHNKSKNLQISETVFKDLVLFDDDNAKSLMIKETLFQNGILLPNSIESPNLLPWWHFRKKRNANRNNKRNTELIHSSVWCILKNQALTRNDKINALEYRRYEMNSYALELKEQKNKCQEKIVLWLNSISNNHGLNWFKGVTFTFIVWILFFIPFIISSNNFRGVNYFSNQCLITDKIFWIEALNFLWIPQGIEALINGVTSSSNICSIIIMIVSFLLGKIAIGYGVFQTISAFRKHGQI